MESFRKEKVENKHSSTQMHGERGEIGGGAWDLHLWSDDGALHFLEEPATEARANLAA